ncbi:MAG: hypothetical protein K5839_01165 [Treponemataceae bacterium]|nr:hypothetical protein [Treponemataceae bacterium]
MNYRSENSQLMLSQKRRDMFSALITFVFCGILLIILALIPVKNKKYKEIRVQLLDDKIEVPVKTEELASKEAEIPAQKELKPKSEPAPKKAAAKANSEKVQTAKKEPAPKASAPEKSVEKKSTPAKIQPIGKTMEERMAENAARSSGKKASWDDFDFDDEDFSEVTSSSTSSAEKAPQGKSSLSGSAAASSSSLENASIESGRDYLSSSSTSESTSQMLSKISGTDFVEFGTSEKVAYAGSGMLSSRQPISTPPITFTPELEDMIQRSVKVKITMQIDTKGFVIPSSIIISPENLLPAQVNAEIRRQISKWLFESGQSNGQSTFNYSINIE